MRANRNLPQQRRKRLRVKQNSQPRKRRRNDEAAVVEERLRQADPVEMQSSDFRARSKMKAMRLILKMIAAQRVEVLGREDVSLEKRD